MDHVSDNSDDLARRLNELSASIDFTRPGRNGSLGKTLIGIVHEAIVDRNLDEADDTSSPWPANQGKYGERKREEGLPVGVGLRSGGQMISMVEIQGEIRVEPEIVESTYGTNQDARDKANWFTYGSDGPDGLHSGATNQPPRPFYGMNSQDADNVVEAAGEYLDGVLKG